MVGQLPNFNRFLKEHNVNFVDLALGPPPGESTHWTGRELAKAAGVSLRSVQRILEARQLAPHRIRTFKLSKDPEFVEKLRDIVGLYVDPPAHAVVLSVDEKSQIQALDRTQPGLPMKKGRAGTMTHDYKRHGSGNHDARSESPEQSPCSVTLALAGRRAVNAPLLAALVF